MRSVKAVVVLMAVLTFLVGSVGVSWSQERIYREKLEREVSSPATPAANPCAPKAQNPCAPKAQNPCAAPGSGNIYREKLEREVSSPKATARPAAANPWAAANPCAAPGSGNIYKEKLDREVK
ncbi:MAG: hypothetical protein HYY65_14685 [Candidatus Tectomicrobia bacterium]|uniref:Uncharacterized protein n=1 Tax=Tectimicrobiota bacterium TaxID=2528274 RepID=A0A932GS69_UNCTE|nr:hypothetical protein [Candidatus Tectomicrobia bacterium]